MYFVGSGIKASIYSIKFLFFKLKCKISIQKICFEQMFYDFSDMNLYPKNTPPCNGKQRNNA